MNHCGFTTFFCTSVNFSSLSEFYQIAVKASRDDRTMSAKAG